MADISKVLSRKYMIRDKADSYVLTDNFDNIFISNIDNVT